MNLRQLTYFVAIVDEGSFSRAAERLLVAQPSLSQQMKALEAELGGALLERLPKGVRVTAAGAMLLPEARAAIGAAERGARAARSALGLIAGELEVATVTSVSFGILPPTLERWRAKHPALTLRLREYRHRRALDEAVRSGIGDLGIGPRPPEWSGPIVHLGWEEFVVVLPPGDPLAKSRRPLPLDALADHDWVLFAADHGFSELIHFVCARAGFVPRASVHTGQVAAAPHLAAAGMGVTLIPSNIVPAGSTAVIRRLRSPVVREMAAFTRQDFSPLAESYLDVLREQPWGSRPRSATIID
jgi:DNA-binding transcriptional LysR family regulator